MLLGEILHKDVIKPRLEARDKMEAIEELIDVLVEAHELPLSLRDHVVSAVVQRENSMSTGMEHGIALPHGASERVDDVIGALGISREGVPFDSLDGQPARLIILLIIPRDNFQGHVRTLAGVANLLGNAECRDALMAARDADAVMELIEKEEDDDVFFDPRTGA